MPALALLLCLAAPAAAEDVLVLDMARPVITVTLAGQPLTLRVDPAAKPFVTLTPAAAARLGLADPARRRDGGPVPRGVLTVHAGRADRIIPWSEESLEAGGPARSVRVVQPGAPVTSDADGIVSPLLLPHGGVRWVARPATAADRTVTLPAPVTPMHAIAATVTVGGDSIAVELAPARPRSIATAAAGAILAQAQGGSLDGPTVAAPVLYGIERPVRDLVLARPAAIAGLTIARLQVRLFDWAGARQLPPDSDPDAPLLVSKRLGDQRDWAMLQLGADVLAPCAEIAWRRSPPELALTCPAR